MELAALPLGQRRIVSIHTVALEVALRFVRPITRSYLSE